MKDLLKSLNDLKDKREGRRPVKKVALKSKKVDLSLKDDLLTALEDSQQITKNIDDLMADHYNRLFEIIDSSSNVDNLFNEYEQKIENVDELFNEFKDMLNDLGLESSDVLTDNSERVAMAKERFEQVKEELEVYKNVVQMAEKGLKG